MAARKKSIVAWMFVFFCLCVFLPLWSEEDPSWAFDTEEQESNSLVESSFFELPEFKEGSYEGSSVSDEEFLFDTPFAENVRDEALFSLFESPNGRVKDKGVEKEKELEPSLKQEKEENFVAQEEPEESLPEPEEPLPAAEPSLEESSRTILINFTNVSMLEFVRFVSKVSNKNFIFEEADLQFNVTMVSEEPTTVENILTALIQELRIHGLTLIEQDNNFIIHRAEGVRGISKVTSQEVPSDIPRKTELVTHVFRLNTLSPQSAATLIRPLASKQALVEFSDDNDVQFVIVTDLVSNVEQIDRLLKTIDAPEGGLVIGQYVVKKGVADGLVEMTKQIMAPIVKEQPFTIVPHTNQNSIFVVSSPYLVEQALTVMQRLDAGRGAKRIYDIKEFEPEPPPSVAPGQWELDENGNWVFRPKFSAEVSRSGELPKGEWYLDPDGYWYFAPEGTALPFTPIDKPEQVKEKPKGNWELSREGDWQYKVDPGEVLTPKELTRQAEVVEDLPLGRIERTQFHIHKLQYRKGEQIVTALGQIGTSIGDATVNQDLINTINSAQWIESSNSLVLTGTPTSIDKVKELVKEIDTPLRQVFIEMLVIDTTIDDSLTYGVDFSTRSGGGNTSTAQAFLGGASPLPGAMDTSGVGKIPDASSLARSQGFNLGVIGQRLIHNGTQYASLGALVKALHQKQQTRILLNPKILAEDNAPAELFVGINTRFQSQAVSNDEGSIITTNYEFRDVGTTLKVTPFLGSNNDIVSLEIQQEISSVVGDPSEDGENISDISPGPTTRINRTTTRVHVPDKNFLVLSGLIFEEKIHNRNQLPCLGGIPFIGAAFGEKSVQDAKRNVMIFIRPQIIDTEEEIQRLTGEQQDIYKQKTKSKSTWKYEVDEALDFLNLKSTQCEELCE